MIDILSIPSISGVSCFHPPPNYPTGVGGLPLNVRFLLRARAHPFRRGNGKGDIFPALLIGFSRGGGDSLRFPKGSPILPRNP